jgi:hypothetical protein
MGDDDVKPILVLMHPKASSRALTPEAQLRGFIARGIVTADTLVWSEGMANWQPAGDIPGLFSAARPAGIPLIRVGRECRQAPAAGR